MCDLDLGSRVLGSGGLHDRQGFDAAVLEHKDAVGDGEQVLLVDDHEDGPATGLQRATVRTSAASPVSSRLALGSSSTTRVGSPNMARARPTR